MIVIFLVFCIYVIVLCSLIVSLNHHSIHSIWFSIFPAFIFIYGSTIYFTWYQSKLGLPPTPNFLFYFLFFPSIKNDRSSFTFFSHGKPVWYSQFSKFRLISVSNHSTSQPTHFYQIEWFQLSCIEVTTMRGYVLETFLSGDSSPPQQYISSDENK